MIFMLWSNWFRCFNKIHESHGGFKNVAMFFFTPLLSRMDLQLSLARSAESSDGKFAQKPPDHR